MDSEEWYNIPAVKALRRRDEAKKAEAAFEASATKITDEENAYATQSVNDSWNRCTTTPDRVLSRKSSTGSYLLHLLMEYKWCSVVHEDPSILLAGFVELGCIKHSGTATARILQAGFTTLLVSPSSTIEWFEIFDSTMARLLWKPGRHQTLPVLHHL